MYALERFTQKCPVEFKLPGLYAIDAIVRAAKSSPTPHGKKCVARLVSRFVDIFAALATAPEKDHVSI